MAPYFILKPIAFTLRLLRKLLPAVQCSPDEVKYIPSRDAGRLIKIHIYRPPPSASSSESQVKSTNTVNIESNPFKPPSKASAPAPVHLNLCGSGFVISGHGLDDPFCRRLSTTCTVPLTILDIAYRLAPENPFPCALHDAEDVLRWVQAQPEIFDAARISIGGFSAGGALAVSLAGHMPRGTFRALLAFYPACDASVSPFRKRAPEGGGRPLPGWLLWVFQRCYLVELDGLRKDGDGVEGGGGVRDTRVSPALLSDLSRFPGRCLFVTAGQCSLAGEAEGLGTRVKALKEDGGQGEEGRVVVERMEGCGHAWDKFAREGSVQWEKRERAYAMAVEMLSS